MTTSGDREVTPDRWRRLQALYHEMLARPVEERTSALAAACPGDPALAAEVQALLDQPESSAGPLAEPAVEMAARFVSPVGSSLIGRRIGVFEIQALLGVGGMGEVYRARDTRLGRTVAIKILSRAFTGDPDRLARFEREARVLASLNHSNIGTLYGLEEAEGQRALVLEFVEGQALSDRIAASALPVPEALAIAGQIAEALDAAHEKGIVHRDLKPANIMITPAGGVKVLDFGLAKPGGLEAGAMDLSKSPTATREGTRDGVILGTAAYMSPEQTRGKAVDKRTDIWAFGCVLYEMLTGHSAFGRETFSDTSAAILEHEADWSLLPKATPPVVTRLLRRCLEKDVRRRLRDIADAALELGVPGPTEGITLASAPGWPRSALVATFGVALVVGLFLWTLWRPTPVLPETRTDLVTPGATDPASFALSPDGRTIVFEALGEGGSRLWLRSLETGQARPLPGAADGRLPFWSPDGRSIGFFAAGSLKRLDLAGGAAQELAPAPWGRGGTWSEDGVIVFSPNFATHLMRVPATGGASVAGTTLGRGQLGHSGPQFLPDGRRFLFYANGTSETSGIYLASLHGSGPIRLAPADGPGAYVPFGWLLWVRSGTLVAQRLDVDKVALAGDVVTLADGVLVDLWRSAVSVAATGLVAYRAREDAPRQLTWFDRSGATRGTIGDPDPTLLDPRVFPHGPVAVIRTVEGRAHIWLLDGARSSRFTFDPASGERFPVWSPDGGRIVFRSNRTDRRDLHQKLTAGGVEEMLVASDQSKSPTSWSTDGRFILYGSQDPQTGFDLWVLPTEGDRTPLVFLKTPFQERQGAFSPDGRWVVYNSNESGRDEIYARPFLPPGARSAGLAASTQWQVSTAGGAFPVWRPDGKEIYFLNPAGEMMAAPVTVTRSTLDTGAPVRLFATSILGGGVITGQGRQYDIVSDGRFLINSVLGNGAVAPITLVQNWNPEVKK